MTADSEMPERVRRYKCEGYCKSHIARGSFRVDERGAWVLYRDVRAIESRLARTEAALKAAKEALTYYSEYFGGPLVYSKATLALAQIAALEGKP